MTFMHFVLSIIAADFIVVTAFLAISSVKRAKEVGVWVPRNAMLWAYFWLLLGYPSDIYFNITRGTIMFKELPRELLFTGRVKRHYRESGGWRLELATKWKTFMNVVDEGHIREL